MPITHEQLDLLCNETDELCRKTIRELSFNDIARTSAWDIAVMTTNVLDAELATWPGYIQLAVQKARRVHQSFDPNWRVANGYPAEV